MTKRQVSHYTMSDITQIYFWMRQFRTRVIQDRTLAHHHFPKEGIVVGRLNRVIKVLEGQISMSWAKYQADHEDNQEAA
jgi:hypothetical protein